MFIKRSIKVFVIAIVAFAFASVATAYAAANVVPVTGAGEGSNSISGYNITAIHYKLDIDPSNIKSVTFTAAPTGVAGDLTASSNVFAKIDGVKSDLCTLSTGVWTCNFGTPPTVFSAGSLIVIAVE
ncbi:MAG: hypothetical protein IMZ73_13540 [Chloroflexi bacterium]|nr:hypothetical protein [Chloroflexota bacterium]